MNRRHTALFSTFTASLLLAACGGTTSVDEEIAENESAALAIAQCDLRTGDGCERGESCLDAGQIGVCATDRCTSSRQCRDGYVCRINHCLRVDRDERPTDTRPTDVRPTDERPTDERPTDERPTDERPTDERPSDRVCPRGTVNGITACAEGYTSHVISREPLCSTCEPVRPDDRPDRCDGASPSARGDCRQILGWYFNGRSCVPLGGCQVTDAAGLYRTDRACAEDHLRCR